MDRRAARRALAFRPLLLTVAAFSLACTACRERRPEADLPDEPALGVVELGQIGGRIYNEPERAREILESVGMTPDQFEAQVRAVTNDPALAREYTRGFEAVIRPRPQNPASVAPGAARDGSALDSTSPGSATLPPRPH
jgi:hypothetical protein